MGRVTALPPAYSGRTEARSAPTAPGRASCGVSNAPSVPVAGENLDGSRRPEGSPDRHRKIELLGSVLERTLSGVREEVQPIPSRMRQGEKQSLNLSTHSTISRSPRAIARVLSNNSASSKVVRNSRG